MQAIRKKKNHKSEESFHDEWARLTSVNDIDLKAQFEGKTSPEYKEAVGLLGQIKGKKVLNLGCGLGEEAVYLASKGAKVTVVDISSEMLSFTKKLAKRYKVENKIKYYKMSAEDLRFPEKSFDLIYGSNILHHVNIKKTIRGIKRVMKKDALAVFTEPLIYNPIINIYRLLAHKVRTDHEHPLNYADLKKIRKWFPNMTHKELHLFTLLVFVWFFVIERLHPNKVRYWKKIISESDKYKYPFRVLFGADKVFLKIFPFLRRYCWITIIKMTK